MTLSREQCSTAEPRFAREIETVPRLALAPAWSSAHAPGARIGPFELIRPLGRGGMGEVWLARQADGRVERAVALKLPALNQRGEAWRERFRRERDILAKLEHPHIARLYDAGVTSAGQPWLAMEFVEGLSLTQHVASRPGSIAGRLALFRQVLAAVAHAHRHLVVHRDLKPANIMVDASGQVKLLDFGIARLADAGESAEACGEITRFGPWAMTPRYAAPEQLDGAVITTATDIYALGVILQELVAGVARKPLARLVWGDLDAIILKAMRREPGERYASVETFDADILAHLEWRPVAARAGTGRYLAGRFALRHKLPLAMAATVLVTLLAGLVIADRERRVAVAEKARAERHFASVRKLANAFVFDVQREIEHLPGALKARQTLVGTAVQYLDSLADESRTDTTLAVEVAGAYRRLAEISGDSRSAHLGDPVGARRNAQRAAALLEAVEAREPGHIEALREHRVLSLLLGRLRIEGGDSGGVDETAKAVRIAEKITTLTAAGSGDRRNLGATLAEYGGILAVVSDDHAAAAVQLARAIEELEAVARENPADVATRASLAYAYDRGAAGAEATGRDDLLPRANELMEKSVAATLSVMHDDGPRAASYGQTLAKRYNNAARVKLKMGDLAGARRMAILGLDLIERLLAADPRNVNNATIHVGALSTLSGLEHRDRRDDKAIEFARAAIAADARLPAETRRGLIVRENVMSARRALGASACASARGKPLLEEGQAMLLESRLFKRELVDRGIDAREAQSAIRAIDLDLARCDAALARLKGA